MPADNKYTFQIIGTDKTKRAFQSVTASVRKTVNVAGAMGAGIAAGLAVMVTRSVTATTEMTRLAHSVGVGTQTMSEWGHAAKTVNLEGDKMADIFKDVQDKIGDFATTGGGGAADMFEKLNLNIEDFIGLAPDQQLIKVGEALDGVQSRSEKIFFLEALAGDASRLLPLLENGAADLRVLQDEARDLGVSISEIDAAKIEAANRSMERIQAAAIGVSNELAVTMAPIVEVIAEKLITVGDEAGGVSEIIKKGFTVGAKTVGVMANGVHGLKVIFKGLELIARGLNVVLIGGFVKVIEIVSDVGNAIIEGIAIPIRKILELAAPFSDIATDALAGIDSIVARMKTEVPAGMQAFADAQAEAFTIARGELHDLLMEDLPSNVIAANVEKILAEADARAREKVAEIRQRLANGTGEGAVGGVAEDPELAKERERIQARLVILDESYFTELEELQSKHAKEIELIQEAEDQKLLLEDEARQKRLRADDQFETEKTNLTRAGEAARLSLIVGALGQIANMSNTGSKKMFKVQKAAALAQAAVALPAAVIDSYRNAGGYPWGIIPAAAMLATGLAEIRAIKSTKFGGGYSGGGSRGGAGSGSSGARSGSSTFASSFDPNLGSQFNQQQSSQIPATQINLTISGDIIGDSAEAVLTRLKELIDENDVVLFSPNSRQALDLQPA